MAAVQQNGRQTTSSCSTRSLLGITTLLVVLLAVLPSYPSSAMSALSSSHHSLSKRSFFDINCKGLYDKSIFARLDRICQDCYSLYREPELHTLCRYTFSLFPTGSHFQCVLEICLHLRCFTFTEGRDATITKYLCYDSLIRKNCFTTNYFKGCLDALLINDEKDIQRVMKDISVIHQIPI